MRSKQNLNILKYRSSTTSLNKHLNNLKEVTIIFHKRGPAPTSTPDQRQWVPIPQAGRRHHRLPPPRRLFVLVSRAEIKLQTCIFIWCKSAIADLQLWYAVHFNVFFSLSTFMIGGSVGLRTYAYTPVDTLGLSSDAQETRISLTLRGFGLDLASDSESDRLMDVRLGLGLVGRAYIPGKSVWRYSTDLFI